MPIAAIIALVEGVLGNIPADIAAFNALKELLAGGKTTVTKEELQQLRSEAAAAHAATQAG